MTHPCPRCASPLVLDESGERFVCSRRAEGCFEALRSAGERPYDLTPHDGPEAAERILAAKEGCMELAGVAREVGVLPLEDYRAAWSQILDTESLLRIGRLRRRIDQRLAERGAPA